MKTGDYVIVRTANAGVHAGYLAEKNGIEVLLKDSRRLWYWSGAASLSELAMHGVADPNSCQFPCEVTEIQLMWIEIIPCTEKAKKSIQEVPEWSAR